MVRYVPIQLIQFSISNRLMTELRIYLFLKSKIKTGVTQLRNHIVNEYALILNISNRTFKRKLSILRHSNWISADLRGNLFIRSWRSLEVITNLTFKSKVEFHIDYMSKSKFVGYFMGAVIAYQCKLKTHKYWKERKNGRSKQFQYNQHPISISYLSNLLQLPNATVQSYKQKAINSNFIARKSNVEKIEKPNGLINIIDLRKNWEEKSFPKIKGNYMYIIKADSFISLLNFKRYRC